jgi:hypothetical protein
LQRGAELLGFRVGAELDHEPPDRGPRQPGAQEPGEKRERYSGETTTASARRRSVAPAVAKTGKRMRRSGGEAARQRRASTQAVEPRASAPTTPSRTRTVDRPAALSTTRKAFSGQSSQVSRSKRSASACPTVNRPYAANTVTCTRVVSRKPRG